jgi:hypothetical protein
MLRHHTTSKLTGEREVTETEVSAANDDQRTKPCACYTRTARATRNACRVVRTPHVARHTHHTHHTPLTAAHHTHHTHHTPRQVTVTPELDGIDLGSDGYTNTIHFAAIVSVEFIAEAHDFTHAYRIGTSSGIDIYLELSAPDLRQCVGAGQHASVTKEAHGETVQYGLALRQAAFFKRIPPFATRAKINLQSRQRSKKGSGLRKAIEKGQTLASGKSRR